MSNLTISFASLVKNNNGFFKSEKQACFLLSKCLNGVFFGDSNNTYNNITRNEYHTDQTGITKVFKYSQTKKTLKLVWERRSDQDFAKIAELQNIQKDCNFKLNTIRDRIQSLENIKKSVSCKIVAIVMSDPQIDLNLLKDTSQFTIKKKIEKHIDRLSEKFDQIGDLKEQVTNDLYKLRKLK